MIALQDTYLELGPIIDDPQAKLERMLIEEFLRASGYCLHDILFLPNDLRRRLMTGACLYASSRLAEIELRAHFVEEIQTGS